MERDPLFDDLKKNPLLHELSEAEIASLLPFFHPMHVKGGDWILREGEKGEHVFFLQKGSAEIIKKDPDLHETQRIGLLRAGDWVGEMAHFEKISRSASVRALEDSELFVFDLAGVQTHPELKGAYSMLALRLASQISRRLRESTEKLVRSLQEKLHFVKSVYQVSQTLIYFFLLIAVWLNSYKLVHLLPGVPLYIDQFLTVLFVILGGIASVLIVRNSHFPLAFYGITLRNLGKNSWEAALYSTPILALILVLKWILIQNVDALQGIPLLASPLASGLSLASYAVITIAYIVLVPTQEFITRGLLQTCLKNFFQGPNRVILAIIASNLVFGILHTVKDFWLAIATFFLGIFWGYLFERQRSLIGPSVSHILIGAWTFSVLDFQQIIDIMNR